MLDAESDVNFTDDFMASIVCGGADSERCVGGSTGGTLCTLNSSGLSSALSIISLIALRSKPACFGRSILDRVASPLGSLTRSSDGNDTSEFSVRGGSSSSRRSDLEFGFLREEPSDAPDGGRDTVAGEDITDDFFLRENQPFFCCISSSLTTIRSSLKSGSCRTQ